MSETVHGRPASADTLPPAPSPTEFAGPFAQAAGEAEAALGLEDPVRAVHELRKAFKRLRALLRLIGGEHRDEAKALRAALGEVARRLAGARDTQARRDALADLAAKSYLTPAAHRAAARALAAGGAHEAVGLAPHREDLTALVVACREAGPRFAARMDRSALLRALRDEYARGRRLVRSIDPGDPESLHELRKAVVAQRYQMELVSEAWPALGKLWVAELQRLRDKLGKHQDLAVLAAELAALPAGRQSWRQPLTDAIAARQARLVLSALRLHRRLFAETPRAFRRRLKVYLKAVSEKE
ncbi:CHAD domain-containing protein [Ancylobacter sp. SL191]|uniref:CHAD domain-containing protein n=1 Tax=Ancylobacter sp. SL191 TaxID=2995166 RepID=UPI00226DDA93|nr:CHAD domain-containing protein [Ancylobacter sp. SL191]WAC28794.1 CHAD domain-containing protein [Ancylobacter sp. SL191]